MAKGNIEMQVCLPVMSVEIKLAVSDWNYKMDALPRMMLIMLRDGRSLADVCKVTHLPIKAIEQEHSLLHEQGFLQEDDSLSPDALTVLHIYEFERQHGSEHYFYWRDMLHNILLSETNCQTVSSPSSRMAWLEWPSMYNAYEEPKNLHEAVLQIFFEYSELLAYYEVICVSRKADRQRRYVPFQMHEFLYPATEEDEQELLVSVVCWLLQAEWETENGRGQAANLCLTPWGYFLQRSDLLVAESDEVPQLHWPQELESNEVMAAFFQYLWNERISSENEIVKIKNFMMNQPQKLQILFNLPVEEKIL